MDGRRQQRKVRKQTYAEGEYVSMRCMRMHEISTRGEEESTR